MELLKNTFLFRAYKEFRLLFVVVCIWAVGSLYYALKSHEEFPFLLFGMYSLKEEAQLDYVAYSVVVDGHEIVYEDLPDAEKELIATSVGNAADVITSQNRTIASAGFINWVKRYAANGKPLEIYRLTCLYASDGNPLIKKRELLYPHDEL